MSRPITSALTRTEAAHWHATIREATHTPPGPARDALIDHATTVLAQAVTRRRVRREVRAALIRSVAVRALSVVGILVAAVVGFTIGWRLP